MHRRFRRSTITFADRGFDTTSIHRRCASAKHINIQSSLSCKTSEGVMAG